jgi:hypothetical protein
LYFSSYRAVFSQEKKEAICKKPFHSKGLAEELMQFAPYPTYHKSKMWTDWPQRDEN